MHMLVLVLGLLGSVFSSLAASYAFSAVVPSFVLLPAGLAEAFGPGATAAQACKRAFKTLVAWVLGVAAGVSLVQIALGWGS